MATILVVDDHQANRDFLVSLLSHYGHRLIEAADGLEALAAVRAARPDVVICDILMPTMDGYQFVRRLRAEPGIAATNVIFCTAHYLEKEARALAESAGVARIITKPCEPDVALRMVGEALGVPKADIAPPSEAFDGGHLHLVTDKLAQKVNELHASNERLRALVDLNVKLVSHRDPVQLLEDVCGGARTLLGARYAALAIREKEGARVHFAVSGMPAAVAARLGAAALDRGVLAAVMATRASLRARLDDALDSGLPQGFPPVQRLLAAPVVSHSAVYGWFCAADKVGADDFGAEDEQLLAILGSLVGRSYENGSFYSKVQMRAAEQLQVLSRRLVEVQESERRELSRELHDRVGQNLTALGINLDILGSALPGVECPELRSRLEDSIALVDAIADAIENVMSELRPPMLDDHGLLPALQWYAKEFSRRTEIEVAVDGEELGPRAPQEVEITLFRIVQEALNNVAKHARARRVSIALDQSLAESVLTVSDDGVGFDPAVDSAPRPGRGIATMRERAQAVGGRFEVRSVPGDGTQVTVRVPS